MNGIPKSRWRRADEVYFRYDPELDLARRLGIALDDCGSAGVLEAITEPRWGFCVPVSTAHSQDCAVDTAAPAEGCADLPEQLERTSRRTVERLISVGELCLLMTLRARQPEKARSEQWIYEQIGSSPDEIERQADRTAHATGLLARLIDSTPDWSAPPAGPLHERLRWLIGRLKLAKYLDRERETRPLVEECLEHGKSLDFLGLHPLDLLLLFQHWGLSRKSDPRSDPVQTLYERSQKMERHRRHPYFEQWQLNEATARAFMMEGVDRRPFIFGR